MLQQSRSLATVCRMQSVIAGVTVELGADDGLCAQSSLIDCLQTKNQKNLNRPLKMALISPLDR